MAATNKCLARSNKSRRVASATKDTNGHWTFETAALGHAHAGHPEGATDLANISLRTAKQAEKAAARDPRRCSHLQGQNRMTTKRCPVCATSDEPLIRTCLLRGVVPSCLGGSKVIAVATRIRQQDQKIANDD
jgi:hypothetical protein